MKKYIVELTKEQLEKLGIEPEPEFTYPLFKQFKDTGEIILFTSMTKGIMVWEDGGNVGYASDTLINHTDNRWKDVAYDSERDLWDGQPIECWDSIDIHRRYIGFYDAKNRCSFNYKGRRTRLIFDNYKAISSDRYDEWILEAYRTLEK